MSVAAGYCGHMQTRIYGETSPILELVLNPGELVHSWCANAAWMTESVEIAPPQKQTDKSWLGKLFSRRPSAEDVNTLVTFRAGRDPGMVAFAPRLPGEIVTVDVRPDPATTYLCAADSLMCVEEGVIASPLPTGDHPALGSGMYGRGFALLSLTGVGRAWIGLGGTVVSYDLRPDEIVRVHPGHLGMAQATVTIAAADLPDMTTPTFPDGIRFIELAGPGRVWLMSCGVGPVAEAIDDFSAPIDVPGTAVHQPATGRGAIREALFPRPGKPR